MKTSTTGSVGVVPGQSSQKSSRNQKFLLLAMLGVVLTGAGCFGAFRSPTVPMATTVLTEGTDTSCLFILLPGRANRPEAFAKEGFAEGDLRGCAVMAVDAHLGYYRNRSIVDRLRQDVVLPAREDGFEEIWMSGVSLGGLGSLLYAKNHPAELTGVFAIAPFLGEEDLLNDIRQQGGLRSWELSISTDDRSLAGLWTWLQDVAGGAPAPRLYLAFGREDSFAEGGELLAEVLPEEHTFRADGGHDWRTWRLLWRQFLISLDL